MAGRFVWIIIAVLLGAAFFGILKSLELLRENERLSHSVAFLTSELEGAKKEIAGVKSDLSQSRMINAQLEDDAAELKGKLAKTESKLAQFQEYAVILRKKYGEVLVMTKSLDETNRQMSGQLLRLNLENQEFRVKFSSEKGLKEAIRELKQQKRKTKARPQRTPASKKKILILPSFSKQKIESVKPGNQGFLVKDGRSTIESLVDIRVEPVSFAIVPDMPEAGEVGVRRVEEEQE
jgi:hypothetical protein